MEINLIWGLQLSIIIAVILAISGTSLFWVTSNFGGVKQKRIKNINFLVLTIYFGIVTGISYFLLIYPLINTTYNIKSIANQLISGNQAIIGIISQRIATVMIGRFLWKSSNRFGSTWSILSAFRLQKERGIYVIGGCKNEVYIRNEWRNLSQIAVYAIVALIVYIAGLVTNDGFLIIAILNFVLLFIYDDWGIIHKYSTELKVDIFQSHKRRINRANAILFFLGIFMSWSYFDWKFALFNTVVIFVSFYWRYFYKIDKLLKEFRLLGNTIPSKNVIEL